MAIAAKSATDSMSGRDPLQASAPEIRQGYLAAAYYGQRRSGDFYDFLRVKEDRVLFGLFDVAGRLEDTRAILAVLQENFRDLGSSLFAPGGNNDVEALLELWVRLNETLMKAAGGVHSCPAFLGCYNEDVKLLTYLNAGHNAGLFWDGEQVRELRATALPLGLFSHSVPDASVIGLGAGHSVLVVSKGVVEAKHRGEEFGLERAKAYLEEIGFETAYETCVGLLARVRQFMGTAPTHNDVTAMALVRSL